MKEYASFLIMRNGKRKEDSGKRKGMR